MKGLLDLIRQRPGMAAGGALGALAGGPAGLLAGAAAAPVVGGLLQNARNKMTASEQELEERALRVSAMRRKEDAAEQLPSMLAEQMPGFVGPPVPQQMQQQRTMGLLAQLAPQTAAQGLLGQALPQQERAAPAVVREMEVLGFPLTQQGFAEYQRVKGSQSGGDLDGILKRLQALKILGELEDRQDDQSKEGETEDVAEAVATNESVNLLEGADTLFKAAAQLEASDFLRPGSAMMGARQTIMGALAEGADLAGFDQFAANTQSDLSALNRLKKGASDFVINLADRVGASNRAQQQRVEDSFANENMDTATIFYATAREMERVLADADARGLDVPERPRWEATLKRLKELSRLPPAQLRMELQGTTNGVEVEWD